MSLRSIGTRIVADAHVLFLDLRGPIVIGLALVALAWVTASLPTQYSIFFRIFSGYSIFTLLIFGFVRFGRRLEQAEARNEERWREHERQLLSHRAEIIDALDHRVSDLQELKKTAAELAAKTRSDRAESEHLQKIRHDALSAKIDNLSEHHTPLLEGKVDHVAEVVTETKQIVVDLQAKNIQR